MNAYIPKPDRVYTTPLVRRIRTHRWDRMHGRQWREARRIAQDEIDAYNENYLRSSLLPTPIKRSE